MSEYRWSGGDGRLSYADGLIKSDGTICVSNAGYGGDSSVSIPTTPVERVEIAGALMALDGVRPGQVWEERDSGRVHRLAVVRPLPGKPGWWEVFHGTSQRVGGVDGRVLWREYELVHPLAAGEKEAE